MLLARQLVWSTEKQFNMPTLNTEFNNIVNTWNNHDQGLSAWQLLSVTGTTTFNTATYTWPGSLPASNSVLQSTSGGTLSWITSPTFLTLTISRLIGGSSAPAVATGTGAGTNATSSIAGSDLAGTVTVNTSNLDTPSANADIATITFNTTYGAAPRLMVMASNDACANLAYGVWRCRQSDTTTTIFKIRSGSTPLPATTTATYTWNYMVIQ